MQPGAAGGVDAAVTAVGGDPVLLGATLAGLAALAVGGWFGWRRLTMPAGERFQRVLGRHDELAVLLHPNPDPDAMACGLAAASLAEAHDVDVTLQFPGQIRRQENRAFQTVLGLDSEPIETASDIVSDAVLLVDHNEPRGFPGADRVDPVAVVDHHPGGGEGEQFTDVRPDHGACATILAEYFEELGHEPGEDGLSSTVATGLLYGIQSDTKHLTSGCTGAEFAAAAYLYGGVDEEALDRIANPEVDASVLDVKAAAITNRRVDGPHMVSDVGTVDNVDAVPQAAEELLRMEGVNAVVVLGDHEGTIHLSGRSRDDRIHMGKALSAAVEDIPMAEAGGHARMGGGQLSAEHMAGIGPSDGVSREGLCDRLFASMNGQRQ
jgi:nanoRNase/pAp phosphatase (c-di-AMP/oligoRNAs hydrolase)